MPAPGRGRGGKFNKAKRGGGKSFSRDLQPIDKDGAQMGMWRDPEDNPEDTSEEEDSEEESEEDEAAGSSSLGGATSEANMTREQRKELARKKKQAAIAKKNQKTAEVGDLPTDSEEESSEEEEEEEDGDLPANPNHSKKAMAQARAVTGASGESPLPSRKEKDNLSRREKEAIAAQAAKERYQKAHAEGKTDEARADMARLRLIRQQREEATARKQAEKEEADARASENKEKLEREEKKRADALGMQAKKGLKGNSGKK